VPAPAAGSRPDGDGNCRPGRAAPAARPPRDDWRREVNSARRGPSAPRPLPRAAPVRAPALPPAPPVSPPQPPESPSAAARANNTGAGRGRPGGGDTRDGRAGSPRPPSPSRSLPPASAVPALLPALPPRRRVPCPSLRAADRPRRRSRPPLARRPAGSRGGLPWPPREPLRTTGRDKTALRPPRAPPYRSPPTAEATAATQPGAGKLRPAPALRTRLGSSPSASCRRHQDTGVRLPHPAAPRAPPSPRAAGGGDTASHRSACQTGPAIYTPHRPRAPRSPPPALSNPALFSAPNFARTRLLRWRRSPLVPLRVPGASPLPHVARCTALRTRDQRVGTAGPRVHLQPGRDDTRTSWATLRSLLSPLITPLPTPDSPPKTSRDRSALVD
jgi:hypothetical protein